LKKFIIGIQEHELLGVIAQAYIIDLLPNKGFYPIVAKLNSLNIDSYASLLNPDQIEMVNIIDKYSDTNLFKLFSKRQKATDPRNFLANITREFAREKIRPYIEKRQAELAEKIFKTETQLYFKEKHKFFNKDHQIKVLKEPAETIFNIIRQEEGTRYFLSIRQQSEDLKLVDKPYRILSHKPCNIIIENKLFTFRDVDAKKLIPFFEKESITIPKQSEKKWFETFALPNIKKFHVHAEGFSINEIKPEPEAVLSLEHNLKGFPSFLLLFRYNQEEFYANQGQKIKVILDDQSGTYRFYKITRNIAWEQNMHKKLEKHGLIPSDLSHFSLFKIQQQKDYEQVLHSLISWISEHKEELQKEGFQIRQNQLEKRFTLQSPELQTKINESTDWFDIEATVQVREFSISFTKLRKHIRKNIREYQLPDGSYFVIPEEWFSKFTDLFKYGTTENDTLRIKKYHYKILESSLEKSKNDFASQLSQLTNEIQNEVIPTPEDFRATLRPYQYKGFQWMALLKKHQFGGCLADDMGLGKTIQTLCLLTHERKNKGEIKISKNRKKDEEKQLNLFGSEDEEKTVTVNGKAPNLIILPTSLIHNWENEINKFSPKLKVYKFIGVNRTQKPEKLLDFDIILTSYGIARNEFEFLKEIPFHYLILDESQYIKNPSSKIYKAVNEIKAENKLVLTGTPIENSLSDLWAQLNFLNKGMLGSYNFFKDEFLTPIEKHKNQEKEEQLNTLIEPFILRRTKEEVAKELPDKTEQTIYCDMTEEQKSYYEEEKSKYRNAILEQIENVHENENSVIKVLEGLSRLRQAAIHPAMVEDDYFESSGKFREIIESLKNIVSEKHKVLIFSSYKKHLRIIEDFIKENNWKYSILTGESRKREEQVAQFQNEEDTRIFLLQIKAGGFGLNLTAADYVFITDPWWNPAVEEQAINRAHRIGQDKKVFVYKFISKDTVEEKIEKLQHKKARLAETFIKPNQAIKHLTKDQILDLFN
jgi:SNF2 family DNA or RNA helicase